MEGFGLIILYLLNRKWKPEVDGHYCFRFRCAFTVPNLSKKLMMVLVDRKTDGFHGEICPEWKKDEQKLETSF